MGKALSFLIHVLADRGTRYKESYLQDVWFETASSGRSPRGDRTESGATLLLVAIIRRLGLSDHVRQVATGYLQRFYPKASARDCQPKYMAR